MVFTGEEIPLRENILKKEVEFVKSWVEWSSENRTQVINKAQGTGTTIMFTVPTKHTLFITSAWISGTGDNIGSVIRVADITLFSTNRSILGIILQDGAADSPTSNNSSYNMPLKVEEGEQIFLVATGTVNASGGFVGFLVPKKIT